MTLSLILVTFCLGRCSTLSSRSEVDLNRTFKFKYSGQSWTGVPTSHNMDTVSCIEMFKALFNKNV